MLLRHWQLAFTSRADKLTLGLVSPHMYNHNNVVHGRQRFQQNTYHCLQLLQTNAQKAWLKSVNKLYHKKLWSHISVSIYFAGYLCGYKICYTYHVYQRNGTIYYVRRISQYIHVMPGNDISTYMSWPPSSFTTQSHVKSRSWNTWQCESFWELQRKHPTFLTFNFPRFKSYMSEWDLRISQQISRLYA